eukprot:168630_1
MLRIVLLGFGSVNQVLLDLLIKKQLQLKALLKKDIVIVGASDSTGAIYNKNGLDIQTLLSVKKQKGSVIYYNANDTIQYVDTITMLKNKHKVEYDMLIDGSPVDLKTGYPGLQCCKYALKNNKKAILANKAPLVLDFKQLHKYSENLRYSAAVCGGLPVVNILKHDLMLPYISSVSEISGIFNSTSNYILTQLTENVNNDSITVNSALKDAQNIGIAETDPTLDLNGSDTANKLCIIMNIIGFDVKFNDIRRSGIELINKQMIVDALRNGNKVYKMIARAVRKNGNDKNKKNEWELTVKCEKVDKNSFIGCCDSTDLCLQIETDLFDTQFYKTNEKDVVGTSAAVLRDIISLALNDQTYSISKL